MRLTLRPARPADAEEMAPWFADAVELTRWGGPKVRFPLTADQLAGWIAEAAAPSPRTCYAAVDNTDRPIGHVQLLHEPSVGAARVGRIGVAPDQRRSGIGAALLTRATDMAFARLGVQRVYLHVLEDNEIARRLYRRAGFVVEGTARNAMVIGGRRHALLTMSVVQHDWEARQAGLAVA